MGQTLCLRVYTSAQEIIFQTASDSFPLPDLEMSHASGPGRACPIWLRFQAALALPTQCPRCDDSRF